MTAPETPSYPEVIEQAKAVLRQGWAQNDGFATVRTDGQACYCVMGAVRKALGLVTGIETEEEYDRAASIKSSRVAMYGAIYLAAGRVLRGKRNFGLGAYHYNDEIATKVEDVTTLLDEALVELTLSEVQ